MPYVYGYGGQLKYSGGTGLKLSIGWLNIFGDLKLVKVCTSLIPMNRIQLSQRIPSLTENAVGACPENR